MYLYFLDNHHSYRCTGQRQCLRLSVWGSPHISHNQHISLYNFCTTSYRGRFLICIINFPTSKRCYSQCMFGRRLQLVQLPFRSPQQSLRRRFRMWRGGVASPVIHSSTFLQSRRFCRLGSRDHLQIIIKYPQLLTLPTTPTNTPMSTLHFVPRGTMLQRTGENCTARSFTIYTAHQTSSGWLDQ